MSDDYTAKQVNTLRLDIQALNRRLSATEAQLEDIMRKQQSLAYTKKEITKMGLFIMAIALTIHFIINLHVH